MKLLIKIICVFSIFLGSYAMAEEHPFVQQGVRMLNIKLSDDRTGIITNINCHTCDFTMVKITPKTKAYMNKVEVDLLQAKMQAGKPALVAFNPNTREVQTIRWGRK